MARDNEQDTLKFHLILGGTMMLIIALVWQLASQSAAPEAPALPEYYIIVEEASWGKECEQTYREYSSKVEPALNNVLSRVSQICNLKTSCTVPANSKTLQKNPYAQCIKSLHVQYRCSEAGLLKQVDAYNNSTATLDCRSVPKDL